MKHLVCLLALFLAASAPSTAQSGWTVLASDEDHSWWSIHMLDASTATVVGIDGSIMHTTDGGARWRIIPSGTDVNLRRVKYHSPSLAVITANDGVILKSTDTGESWHPVSTGVTRGLYDIHFFSDEHWLVIGQGAFITESTDGGATWNQRGTGMNNWNGLDFREDFGILVGNKGDIRITTNGGSSWTNRSSPDGLELRAVSIGDDSTAVAVGINGSLIKTTNKGRNWKIVYASIPMANNRVTGVQHLTAEHLVATAYNGLIIESTDGGENWTPQGSPTTSHLEGLSFIDDKTGMAAGWDGTIIRTNSGGALSVRQSSSAAAHGLSIVEQYPMPLRRNSAQASVLRLNVSTAGHVRITAADILGRTRSSLFDGHLDAGVHTLALRASELPPGSYVLRIAQHDRVLFGRMILE
jgi:photosystem II stability/assembly factor-like uncharacterized protein